MTKPWIQDLSKFIAIVTTRSINICLVCIGNSMICGDIWHKYHEWYFEMVIRNLRQFWNITSTIYAKYHVQIMLLFVYTTTRKGFVIFTCRYFKLSRNTTALSQSNCRNFSWSSIKIWITVKPYFTDTLSIQTPHYYGQFTLSVGKKKLLHFPKFNPLNTDMPLIRALSMAPSVSVFGTASMSRKSRTIN